MASANDPIQLTPEECVARKSDLHLISLRLPPEREINITFEGIIVRGQNKDRAFKGSLPNTDEYRSDFAGLWRAASKPYQRWFGPF